MIPSWFTQQLARLADLRSAPARFAADGQPIGDPNIVLRMWWEGLQGVPEEVLEAAVTHAIQTRTFFPTPAELREDADVAYRRPESETGTGEPFCIVCEDSGWAAVDHRTVKPCPCREMNPVLMQRRAAQARYATGRSK